HITQQSQMRKAKDLTLKNGQPKNNLFGLFAVFDMYSTPYTPQQHFGATPSLSSSTPFGMNTPCVNDDDLSDLPPTPPALLLEPEEAPSQFISLQNQFLQP
ncbi:hypothetical protein PIB30_114280, partial [Stylosanthes scabra]|nr:hypothetical protein [Stylosanthes scabra]